MAKKIALEMLKNPRVSEIGEMPTAEGDTPYDKAMDMLSVLSGPQLEIMTRTTPRMVEASDVAYNIYCNFHSEYIVGRFDKIMRFAVSMGGKGRGEVVDSLKAGAQAYVSQSYDRAGQMGFREIPED